MKRNDRERWEEAWVWDERKGDMDRSEGWVGRNQHVGRIGNEECEQPSEMKGNELCVERN